MDQESAYYGPLTLSFGGNIAIRIFHFQVRLGFKCHHAEIIKDGMWPCGNSMTCHETDSKKKSRPPGPVSVERLDF